MKKVNWDNLIDKSWYWTKVVFLCAAILLVVYGYGTFNPNEFAQKKIFKIAENDYLIKVKKMELTEPSMEYSNDIQFVRAMHKCIDYINFTLPHSKRVPFEMIIGQAALESGWGSSRFANEAKNLFGIRVFSKDSPHLLPQGIENWPGWGVRVFPSKCASVVEYVRLLNEHQAYKEFRALREKTKDPIKLIKKLDNFSTTPDYDKRVIRIIKKIRKLEDTYASDKTIN
tara:strand:- start:1611 stop:2294 length:684 start_codon:yes stop_codon:yes gene_type:complete